MGKGTMSLHAYALTTLESVKNYMRKQDEDLLVPVLVLYNNSGPTEATTATYQVTATVLHLIVTGGTNVHDTSLAFADANKDTLTELVAYINVTLGKGWVAKVIANGSQASSDLALTSAVACLGFANRQNLVAPDNLLLETLINAATDFMEDYCGRRFLETDYTNELYDGDGTEMLFLKNYPIVTITTIYWAYVGVADQLIDSDEYKIYASGGYVYKVGSWIVGHQNIKINYTAGYDFATDGIPSELQDICNALVNLKYNQPDKQGIESERMGGYAVSYSKDDLPADLKKCLNLWRKMDVV
jgi:hypothetical protein